MKKYEKKLKIKINYGLYFFTQFLLSFFSDDLLLKKNQSILLTLSNDIVLLGNQYNHSFWTDAERHFGWDWRYDWSSHVFVNNGYLADAQIKAAAESQNHMFVKNNGSAYEFYAANYNGDASSSDKPIGYICEAQMPCKLCLVIKYKAYNRLKTRASQVHLSKIKYQSLYWVIF